MFLTGLNCSNHSSSVNSSKGLTFDLPVPHQAKQNPFDICLFDQEFRTTVDQLLLLFCNSQSHLLNKNL